MQTNPSIQSLNIVIVILGDFNPAIFHPAWFAMQELVRPQEADAAEIQLVHPDATIFQIDWGRIHVMRERFQARTSQESYFEPLRDLVIGVFTLLSHISCQSNGCQPRISLSTSFRKNVA